ncbi:MAG TPA: hypothetical protein VFP58_05640 [Candidatus Eisenbacteria bacterium]|nr:hypothetical protein [Candidatus Eisenbacteria bacterium]
MSRTGRKLALVLLLSVAGGMLLSCAKDPLEVDRNRPPQTFLVGAPIDTTAADVGYSYRIHLYWRGEDPDGYVVGFLWSWDDSSIGSFRFTTRTDSIFELAVNDSETIQSGVGNPQTSRYHTFFIRAVDNLGKPDPSLTMFNRRLFNAETEVPRVQFVGGIPSGTVGLDTLCDKTPFTVCWTGSDADGFVTRYRVDAGSYRSPLMTDTCLTFNTPGGPTLASGLYTMTVTAVDNANAVGTGTAQFVVNRDPETWFTDSTGGPPNKIGYYLAPYIGGQAVFARGTFAEGDTIPYRSTVWFFWDGEDSHEQCEQDSLTGFAFSLNPGTRDGGSPYIIGFLNELTPGTRFTTNDPEVVGPAGFPALILDSLDAGIEMVARVAARDNSQRPDGTPATFNFNCNFPPLLDSLFVDSVFVVPPGGTVPVPSRRIRWVARDYEDGLTQYATVVLDETSVRELNQFQQELIVADQTFRNLSPSGTEHSVRVRVADRAEFKSALPDGMKTVQFTIPLIAP